MKEGRDRGRSREKEAFVVIRKMEDEEGGMRVRLERWERVCHNKKDGTKDTGLR